MGLVVVRFAFCVSFFSVATLKLAITNLFGFTSVTVFIRLNKGNCIHFECSEDQSCW